MRLKLCYLTIYLNAKVVCETMQNMSYLLKKGSQPTTPAHMDRCVGRTADQKLKQGRRRKGD